LYSSRQSSRSSLRFEQAVEAFHLEQLAAEVAVEGFDERILPGRAGLDVAGVGVVEAAPVAQRLANVSTGRDLCRKMQVAAADGQSDRSSIWHD
jgi:hypothetical protein